MAEKRKDASSSKKNEEPNRRRGPGGGLEPRTHAPSKSTRRGAEALGMAPRGWRPTLEAAASASVAEKRKPAARAGSHHSGSARRWPLLIAGAAPRVTRRASRRPGAPPPG